eukprot:41655_1
MADNDVKDEKEEYFRQIIECQWLPNDIVCDNWCKQVLCNARAICICVEKKDSTDTIDKVVEELKSDHVSSPHDLDFSNMHPTIQKLRNAIEKNPIMLQLIHTMISEVLTENPKSPVKHPRDLLLILNNILSTAPTYNNDHNKINSIPLASAFGKFASTNAGKDLFCRPDITQIFGEYLDAYKQFLDSEKSIDVLYNKPDGWLINEGALKLMQMTDYQTPKSGKYTSWNQYFSRKIKPSARPITEPNNDAIVVSPVDGVIYNIDHNVQQFTNFWIKRQPYSLQALLNNDSKYIEAFVGGSVWQTFLDPFNYHRWHTPVSGEVIDIVQVGGLNATSKGDLLTSQGLYYSILKWEGFGSFKDWTGSLKYMSMVNRRAIIYIKSETVGLVAVIPVGMLEVSSCLVSVKKGDKLKKGDELGMFQYGGSTFAMVFQKDKIKEFTILPPKNIEHKQLAIKMGQNIAVAQTKN